MTVAVDKYSLFMDATQGMSEATLLELARKWAVGVDMLWNTSPNAEKYLRTGDESHKPDVSGSKTPGLIAYWVAQSHCNQKAYEKYGCRHDRLAEKSYREEVWDSLMEELCQP